MRQTPLTLLLTGDEETQRRNLAVLMKQYRLWAQAMVPQLAFDRFLVSLERLASKREFRDRVDAMQHDGTPFSVSGTTPSSTMHDDSETNKDSNSSHDNVVILQAHHTQNEQQQQQEEPFDPSAIDPDDLVEAQEQEQHEQTVDDKELDELERMAAEAEEEE